MASSGASPAQSKDADIISQLATTIGKKINSVAQPNDEGSPRAFHSIFRVPRSLREVDPKAYEPQIVSIGPYHHGKEGLEEMEMHKCRILSNVLNRTGHQVELYLEALMELENKARRSYAEPMKRMEISEFIEMMLLDACFVIELLRYFLNGFVGNPFFPIRSLTPYIRRDLVMVENQLPFFVLDRLFTLTSGPNETKGLPELALEFFDSLIPGIVENDVSNLTQISPHLLALLHYSLCRPQSSSGQQSHGTADSSSLHMIHWVKRLRACGGIFRKKMSSRPQSSSGQQSQGTADSSCLHMVHWVKRMRACGGIFGKKISSRPQSSSGQQNQGTAGSSSLHMVHSVTRLRACGVIFREKKSNNFTDVEFDERNGVLKIPLLQIDDSSKTIFLNLMAFEQGWPFCCNRVTSYLCFMDDLINTSQDVRHLCHKGIIDHGLGSEEHVAHVFNGLCTEIVVDLCDCYLTELAQDLNLYAKKKLHGWMASLKHEYFRHPWAIIGLAVGFMILLLSFAQTFYTIFPYYYPRSR